MRQHGSDPVIAEETSTDRAPGTEEDPILAEHLRKALDSAAAPQSRYHLRAALQRLELDVAGEPPESPSREGVPVGRPED